MKKVILTIALVSGLTMVSKAQDVSKPTPTDDVKKERKHLTPDERIKKNSDEAEKKLGLNAEQKAKWKAAEKERMVANESLKEKRKGSTTPEERKALHKSFRENQEKFETTVVALLSPEQKTKYDQAKKERRDHRKDKMDHHGKK